VLDRAAEGALGHEPHGVDLAALRVDDDHRRVEVDVAAALGRIPAEAHRDPPQRGRAGLDQRDRLPLGQRDPALVEVDLRGRRRRGGGLGGRRLRDRDPEIGGDARQAARVALADRAHLPLPRAAVELDAQQSGLRAEPVGHELGERLPRHGDVHPEAAERAERRGPAAVEARGDDHALDRRVDLPRLDVDARRVVAHPRREGLVVEDEVRVAAHLALGRHQQRRDVDGRSRRDADRDRTGRKWGIRTLGEVLHALDPAGVPVVSRTTHS
jgi:hypothetical protein